jgi:RNA polymerase sigma factor (sigma-70 family)
MCYPSVASTVRLLREDSAPLCNRLVICTNCITLPSVNTSWQTALPETPPVHAKPPLRPAFVTTHWSVVLTAGRSDTPRARDALAKLCQTYWYPLYAYVRRRGQTPEDAQDLTQEFFARLLEKNWVGNADQAKGRFRSFLLSAMNHFLADEWDKARAQKRGGGVPLLPLQLDTAETRYGIEPADPMTPERSFERRWALTLLEEVLNRLRTLYEQEGKADLFARLHPCLVGERTAQPYADLAETMGVSEGTVKSAVHRLRQRYRQLLRDEIANTVAGADEVDEELRHLYAVLAGG